LTMLMSAIGMNLLTDLSGFLGQIEALQAAILIIGIVLLIVEMFTPGFGVAGGLGVVLLVIGIILTARSPVEAVILFLILILLIAIVLAIVLRSASKGKLNKKLVLNLSSRKDLGYTSSSYPQELVGKTGVAITALRPAGTGEFDDFRLDVVTEGDFVDKDTRIRVLSVSGNRIVVEATDKS
jgi:membrane-bound ClpP family serine protease